MVDLLDFKTIEACVRDFARWTDENDAHISPMHRACLENIFEEWEILAREVLFGEDTGENEPFNAHRRISDLIDLEANFTLMEMEH